ncbi:LysM peptidoglycan-binding domain-containing protein [Candidatus Saccharibacteria bacterium]|nr:LysM peptidoglycan-binding domain-containing protein [Candidatus Saccharibacteria bacterium]
MAQAAQKALSRKTVRRRVIRISLVAFNVALLLAVVGVLTLKPADTAKPLLSTSADTDTTPSPLDQLSSANIALTVAEMSNLPEKTPIVSQAISEDVELTQAATVSSSVSTKPQVVASAFKSAQDIKQYVVVKGDTVSKIASKFGVTSDSIRWSNNLTGNSVATGRKLWIPPVNGIVYVVKAGEDAATIAAKFDADRSKIIAFNDAELSGLKKGQRILVPYGSKASLVASTRSISGFSGTASYGYNGYDFGYCTYWVAVLRQKAGNPVPANLGNAATWAIRAAAYGLPTGSTPRVGAAVVTSTSGAGHVAYVTKVNSNGSIVISEMNHAGWNRTDTRTISGNFRYVY